MSVKHCTGKRSQSGVVTGRRAHNYQQSSDVRDVLYGNSASANVQTGANAQATSGNAQATVTRYNTCGGKRSPEPANASSILDNADSRASGFLQSASIFSVLAGFGEEHNLQTQSAAGNQAYESRFGPPEQVGRRFRNRFTGDTYATESAAKVQELYSLSNRFDQLSAYLDAGITYRCNTNSNISIATCTDRCSRMPDGVLWTCSNRASHAIAVCSPFWSLAGGDDQRAIGIIHELAHQRFEIHNHLHGNARQRGANPECYASYVADNFGVTPFDTQCPPV